MLHTEGNNFRAGRDSNRRILSTWKTSYSGMSNDEAEARLGLQLRFLEEVPIRKIAPAKSWGVRAKAEELVFGEVPRFLQVSGVYLLNYGPHAFLTIDQGHLKTTPK